MKIKGELIHDLNWNINDFSYKKGQVLKLKELEEFPSSYALYTSGTIDWIPKSIVRVLSEQSSSK